MRIIKVSLIVNLLSAVSSVWQTGSYMVLKLERMSWNTSWDKKAQEVSMGGC